MSRVSPYTSFELQPLPVYFTTEQSTVKASLFVKYMYMYMCLYNQLCLVMLSYAQLCLVMHAF